MLPPLFYALCSLLSLLSSLLFSLDYAAPGLQLCFAAICSRELSIRRNSIEESKEHREEKSIQHRLGSISSFAAAAQSMLYALLFSMLLALFYAVSAVSLLFAAGAAVCLMLCRCNHCCLESEQTARAAQIRSKEQRGQSSKESIVKRVEHQAEHRAESSFAALYALLDALPSLLCSLCCSTLFALCSLSMLPLLFALFDSFVAAACLMFYCFAAVHHCCLASAESIERKEQRGQIRPKGIEHREHSIDHRAQSRSSQLRWLLLYALWSILCSLCSIPFGLIYPLCSFLSIDSAFTFICLLCRCCLIFLLQILFGHRVFGGGPSLGSIYFLFVRLVGSLSFAPSDLSAESSSLGRVPRAELPTRFDGFHLGDLVPEVGVSSAQSSFCFSQRIPRNSSKRPSLCQKLPFKMGKNPP